MPGGANDREWRQLLRVVAFVASDGAVAMTGTVANLTGGIVVE
jgi:hypothetical protein